MTCSLSTIPPITPSQAISARNTDKSAKALLTSSELVRLGRNLATLLEVGHALSNCPMFHEDRHTAVADRFDRIVEAIGEEYVAVMAELRASRPRYEREAEDRSCDLLINDLSCDQDATDVALAAVRKAFPGRY